MTHEPGHDCSNHGSADQFDEFWARPFRTRFLPPPRREEQAVFTITKARWNAMSVDGFSTIAERSRRAGRTRPAEAGDHAVDATVIVIARRRERPRYDRLSRLE